MRVIKASEIGSFLFCRRAWWYRRQGMKSGNTARLAAGTRRHQQHSTRLAAAGWLQTAALMLLMLAVGLVVYSYIF